MSGASTKYWDFPTSVVSSPAMRELLSSGSLTPLAVRDAGGDSFVVCRLSFVVRVGLDDVNDRETPSEW